MIKFEKNEHFSSTIILIPLAYVGLPPLSAEVCLRTALPVFLLWRWVEVSNLGKNTRIEQIFYQAPVGAGLGAFYITSVKVTQGRISGLGMPKLVDRQFTIWVEMTGSAVMPAVAPRTSTLPPSPRGLT